MGPDGGFITGSDFLMDGGVTAAYWYGDLAPNDTLSRSCGRRFGVERKRGRQGAVRVDLRLQIGDHLFGVAGVPNPGIP